MYKSKAYSESPRVSERLRGLSTGVLGLHRKLLIIPILSLGGRDISEGFEESLVVKPGQLNRTGDNQE